jgi:hypothetical protein
MDQELKSEGKCLYCEQLFSQKEIGKHLALHLEKMEKDDKLKAPQTFCHIEVEAEEMFLHLLVKGSAPMKKIDGFLRSIWLECCGHLSDFGHKNFKIKMNHHVEVVLQTKTKIFHDYDFGSTTRVFLKGLKHYQLDLQDSLILLSRNEPLKIMCNICKKKPAVNLCEVCLYEAESFFCESCSAKHAKKCDDFADYANMPIVNSPRMGVCGYEGGSIDLERDGTYQPVKQ